MAAFCVKASGGLGDLYAPLPSLTAGDAKRPSLLGYIKGMRFIRIEAEHRGLPPPRRPPGRGSTPVEAAPIRAVAWSGIARRRGVYAVTCGYRMIFLSRLW